MPIGRACRPSYASHRVAAVPRDGVGAAAAETRRHARSRSPRTCGAPVGPAGPPTKAHDCSMPIGRACRPSYASHRVAAVQHDGVGAAAAATRRHARSRALRTCGAPVGPAGPPTKAHDCSMPIGRACRPSYASHRVAAVQRDGVGAAAAATRRHARSRALRTCGSPVGPAGPPTKAHDCSMPIGRACRPSYASHRVAAAHRDGVGAAAAATRRHARSRALRTCGAPVGPAGPPTKAHDCSMPIGRACRPSYESTRLLDADRSGLPALLRKHTIARCRSVEPAGPPTQAIVSLPCSAMVQERRQPRQGAAHDRAHREPAALRSGLPALLRKHTIARCRSVEPAGPPTISWAVRRRVSRPAGTGSTRSRCTCRRPWAGCRDGCG